MKNILWILRVRKLKMLTAKIDSLSNSIVQIKHFLTLFKEDTLQWSLTVFI